MYQPFCGCMTNDITLHTNDITHYQKMCKCWVKWLKKDRYEEQNYLRG